MGRSGRWSRSLSWPWICALLAATVLNLVTFAPPWMIVLPGLSFIPAMKLTQASSALSIVVPGGAAAGLAGAYGILRRWGFATRDIARALTLTGLWNQLLNLCFPVVAVFLLTISGENTATLATAAFVGVAVLGVVVTGLVLVLISDRLARDIGEVAARFANWALGKVHRGPVGWSGASFERFRESAGDLLDRRWHVLTLASLAGSLSVFGVLLVSLRALGVGAAEVSFVDAFAAWALVRLIASVPITPGGIGVVELGLTGALVGFGGNNAGRRRRRSGLSLPHGRSDSRARARSLVHLAPRREDSSLERSCPTPFGALTMSELRGIGGDLEAALETVNVPSYVIDPTGVIRWINPAARRLVGDVRGRQFTSVVAPEDTRRAREHFARKIVGSARVTDAQVVLVDADGGRVQVDVSSCVLMDGHRLVGVFGQISDVEEEPDDPLSASSHATPDRGSASAQAGPLDRADRAGAAPEYRNGEESCSAPAASARRPHTTRGRRGRSPGASRFLTSRAVVSCPRRDCGPLVRRTRPSA